MSGTIWKTGDAHHVFWFRSYAASATRAIRAMGRYDTGKRGERPRFSNQGETESDLLAIRRATHSGRPLGPAEFIKELESGTQRRLTPLKGGRPRKNATKATDRNF